MAALYLNHPYGRPVIGWHQEIEKLNREDALEFYKRFAPNNATLILAGDKRRGRTADGRSRLWQDPAAAFDPAAPDPAAGPTPAGPRTVTLADPRVEQPSVRRYYLVPSAVTAAPEQSAALEVLAQLMGTGSNSMLYRALVVDKPLAVSAGAWYQGTGSIRPSSAFRPRRNPAWNSRRSSRPSTR
jgi:zinc protease